MVRGERFDAAVVGGGIVGLASARALVEEQGLRPVVLEAEPRLAAHQTGRNSGVVHSGLYYRPGSLKAGNCAEGRRALRAYCMERGIPFEPCGKVVVAVEKAELPALEELERRGRANGLCGIERLGPEGIREHEPHARGVAGLWVPETGITDFSRVAEAYARDVRDGGGEVRTSTRFLGLFRERGGLVIETSTGPVRARLLVNCAGLHADRVARRCGRVPEVKIIPFRGEYYTLAPERMHLVRGLIYPVPDPRFPFLGVHFTRKITGGVEAGPNAVLAFKREGYTRFSFSLRDCIETFCFPGFRRLARRYWRTGLHEFRRSFSKAAFVRSLQKLVPEIRRADVRPGGAGVRAQAVDRKGTLLDDFCIQEGERSIHVLNTPSPAATASLAIGRHVARLAAARVQ